MMSTGYRYIIGICRSGFDFEYPSRFDIFHGATRVGSFLAETVLLSNNSIVYMKSEAIDHDFKRITLATRDIIERSLIEDRNDVYLLRIEERAAPLHN